MGPSSEEISGPIYLPVMPLRPSVLLLILGLASGVARAQAGPDTAMVEVQSVDRSIRVQQSPIPVRPAVAQALGRVARRLATGAVGLEVLAGKGSRPDHDDGRAVDLRLVDLSRGTPLPMGSEYRRDDGADTTTVAPREARYRRLLSTMMTGEGFVGDPARWWHYELRR